MKEWITSVSIIAIVISLSDFILPNGKTQKTLRCIFGFCCIIVMSLPMMKLVKGEFSLQNFESAYSYQENYLEFINDQIESEMESELCDLFVQNNISVNQVEVTLQQGKFSPSTVTLFGVLGDDRQAARELIVQKFLLKEESIYFEEYHC